MTDDEILTAPEAGQILGRSARTIQRLIDSGSLPVIRKLPGPNGAFLLNKTAVEAYRDSEPAAAQSKSVVS